MSTTEYMIINHLSGILLLITAFIFVKFPPKKINGIYGYRTLSSMKDQVSWDIAQRVSAMYMLKGSVLLVCWQVVSFLIVYFLFPQWKEAATLVNAMAIVPVLIVMIFKTEKALKRLN